VSDILLVEDNSLNAKLMETLLRQRGHTIVVTRDVPTALAALANGRFSFALVDLHVPGGGGEAVVSAMARGEVPRVPAIAVTADNSAGIVERLRALGFAGYIPKPVDARTFANRVGDLAQVMFSAPPLNSDDQAELDALRVAYRRKLPGLIEAVANAALDPVTQADALEGAHRLAGAAGSYGFRSVGTAARELEHALNARAATSEIERLVATLRTTLQDA
jgi:CheY-like chemotaxis protein